MRLSSQEEDGIDTGNGMVHMANAALVFKVFGIAQTTDNMGGTDFFAKRNGEFLKWSYFDVGLRSKKRLDVRDFFVGRKKTLLLGIDAYANDHFVEQTEGLMYNGFMAFCKRIKTSRKKTAFHVVGLKKLK